MLYLNMDYYIQLFEFQLTTTVEQTTLDDLSAEVMELCTKSTKMYNDSSLQSFFEAYIDNMVLVKWLTEVTSSMWYYLQEAQLLFEYIASF